MLTKRDEGQLRVAAKANRLYGLAYFVLGAIVVVGLVVTDTGETPTTTTVVFLGQHVSLLKLVAAGVGTIAAIGGAATITVAIQLERRRGRLLCIVVSAINATSVPIGTLLGVSTIVLLLRPSVADAFGAQVAA